MTAQSIPSKSSRDSRQMIPSCVLLLHIPLESGSSGGYHVSCEAATDQVVIQSCLQDTFRRDCVCGEYNFEVLELFFPPITTIISIP